MVSYKALKTILGASLEAASQELATIKVNNYVYNKNRNRTTECN